jgi:hypothetical protein
MMGDKAGRLYALEGTPTASTDASTAHPWGAEFELTPAMMGPAIDVDAMTSIEEDAAVVTMPELHVTALPIVGATGDASEG